MISQFLYNKASESKDTSPEAKPDSTTAAEDTLDANPLDNLTKAKPAKP